MAVLSTSLDASVWSIGATSYIAALTSLTLTATVTDKSCKALNARYDSIVETKREMKISAEHKRRAGTDPCQTMRTATAFTLNGASVLATAVSGNISFENVAVRSDAGGDALSTMQLTGTNISGSAELNITGAATTSELVTLLASGAITTTFTFTDAVGSVSVPVKILSATQTISTDGIATITVTFKGTGAPTSSGGTGTLFALGLSGSADANVLWDDGVSAWDVDVVILSGDISFSRDERTMEKYEFHVNAVN